MRGNFCKYIIIHLCFFRANENRICAVTSTYTKLSTAFIINLQYTQKCWTYYLLPIFFLSEYKQNVNDVYANKVYCRM